MNSPPAPHGAFDSPRSSRSTIQLLTFFAAAFVIAWAAWIPLFANPSLPSQISFIGMFAPAIAAVLTAAIFGGASGVKDIFRRFLIVRFPLHWALGSALIMPAIYFAAIPGIRVFRIGDTGPLFTKNSPLFILTAFVWILFVTSGEEIGWRGYALPLLLERSDRFVLVSLGFGLTWGVWHLPIYLAPGGGACPIPLFLILTSLLSVLYTVVFLRTKGSLLPALLLHAGTDIAPRIFQLAKLPVTFWLMVDLVLGLVVAALLIGTRRKLRSAQQWRAEINISN